jgi:transposase InsO family protein
MSMDITGPHPRSKDGNEYILTVMDSFTKYAEAFPIRAHTAQIASRRLVDHVFSRYGVPLRLLSDQGPEFESALMAELCRVYGIEKIRTTSYKPSTNAAVERFHRTLNSMLGKVVSETQRDWDRHVAPVMAAYRATVHSSTNYSPNFLVYGRENRAPVDLVLAVGDDEPEGVGQSTDAFVQELVDRQRRAYDLARKHLGQAAERRKREYDLHVRDKQFKQGQWVYWFYPRRYKGRSPKWARQYTGPYLITRVIPPCNYVIQKSSRSRPIVTHTDKLKACLGDTPKSWLTDEGGESPEEDKMSDVEGVDDLFEGGGGNVATDRRDEDRPDHRPATPDKEVSEVGDGGVYPPPTRVHEPTLPIGSPGGRLRKRDRLQKPVRYRD